MYGTWVLITIIIASSLPVIAVYLWYRFAKYPVSPVKFLIVLLIGAAAVFPAILLQNLMPVFNSIDGRAKLFYEYFVRIAFTEELSRMLLLFIFFLFSANISNRSKTNNASGSSKDELVLSWNTVKKGTSLGLVAGLGFAILETAVYTIAANMDVKLLLLRAVTAAPLHAACGSRVGSAAIMLRTNPVQAIFRLLIAAVIHGIYNLMIVMPGFPVILAFLIVFSALVTAILSIKGNWEETGSTPS